MKKLFPFIAVLLLSLGASAQIDVHSLADQVDAHYNNLQTLRADFTETYSGGGIARNESGTLLLKRPGKMRWDYRSPREKLFLSDGHSAWFYVPGDHQARRAPIKQLDDLRSPLRYLLGKTRLEKEFNGLSLAPDVPPATSGDVVLRGVPKHMEDRVNQVLLEIAPDGAITRIVISENDGSTTEFRLTNQQENVPLADSQFKFHPPEGVEIVDEASDQSF
jgi:outer membrane lipoprotein carrier protein